MSTKFSLISGIESAKHKIKYQVFEADIGFERVSVLIPIEQAEEFQEEVIIKQPKSTTSLKKIAEKFGGLIE